jgi:hypothetical protein
MLKLMLVQQYFTTTCGSVQPLPATRTETAQQPMPPVHTATARPMPLICTATARPMPLISTTTALPMPLVRKYLGEEGLAHFG